MGHGIARFSPNFCCDKMRFRNLGKTEAQFWEETVLAQIDSAYDIRSDGTTSRPASGCMNEILYRLGLEEDVCRDILNPGETGGHAGVSGRSFWTGHSSF